MGHEQADAFQIDYNRVPVHYEKEPEVWARMLRFLGHYDLRIYVSNKSYVDIGAGSLHTFLNLKLLQAPEDFSGCLGAVGRWCEFHTSAEVMGRGEHDHDQPVNVTFALLRRLSPEMGDMGMRPMQSFRIGNGVVISSGAKIMSGVALGDGCVVGASAVVTHDVEPYAIVGGVPAKPIRHRPSCTPWWDFSTRYLLSNMANLQSVAASDHGHDWRRERPRFVMVSNDERLSLVGFTDGDRVAALAEAPQSVRDYLTQAFQPGPNYWSADCWE